MPASARPIALLVALVISVSGCSGEPDLNVYFEGVGDIGRRLEVQSFGVVSATNPTHAEVTALIELRRVAVAELRALEVPEGLAALHEQFALSLEQLVGLADQFLDETADLDDAAFREALTATAAIDEAQFRVQAFCGTLEIEGEGLLGTRPDLACG